MQAILGLLSSKYAKLAGLVLIIVLLFLIRLTVPGFSKTKWIYWYLIALLIILIWVVWIIFDAYRMKRKEKGLSDGLVDDARKDESSARPDRRETYRRIRENLEYTINLLKTSCPSEFKGAPLYRLPWIMVVGPPADGKTTAIKNSGIRWPHDPRLDEGGAEAGRELEGFGGTRSCNWFFSRNAIIIDTAGRWQAREQGEADQEEWLHFLQLIQKFRPNRPINGIIAVISIEKIIGNEEKAFAKAREIRRQMNEIMEKLGTHVPVYMVISKCDLIHGFVEYFQDLNDEGRHQIWGFTRKYKLQQKSKRGSDYDSQTLAFEVESELIKLNEVLEERRKHRLADPVLFPSERAALCIFPSEFKTIVNPIKRFVEELFSDNPYGYNPVLRGIYFTSATQFQGNPIVQLMKQVAGDYEIPLETFSSSSKKVVNTYFLHDLLHNVVFKDEHLGGRFKRSLPDKIKIGMAAVLGVLAVFCGIWMISAFMENSYNNNKLQKMASGIKDIKGNKIDSAVGKLSDFMGLLTAYSDAGLFNWLLGVHEYGDLAETGKAMLSKKMEAIILTKAWDRSEKELSTRRSYDSPYSISAYRTYNYLSDKEMAKMADTGILCGSIFAVLKNEFKSGKNQNLCNLLKYYFDKRSEVFFAKNSDLLCKASENIYRKWNWSFILSEVLSSYQNSAGFFVVDDCKPISSSYKLNNVFMASNWDTTKDLLDSAYESIKHDTVMQALLRDKLFSDEGNPLYISFFETCLKEWNGFFNGLNYEPSDELLNKIGVEDGPLENLLKKISEETSFHETKIDNCFMALYKFTGTYKGTIADKMIESVKPEETPSDTQLKQYMKILGQLMKEFEEVNKSVTEPDKFSNKVGTLKDQAQNLSDNLDSFPALVRLLVLPFDLAKIKYAKVANKGINDKWKEEIYDNFEAMKAMYPLSRENKSDELKIDVLINFAQELIDYHKNLRIEHPPQWYNKAISSAKTLKAYLENNCKVELEFSFENAPEDLKEFKIVYDKESFSFVNQEDEELSLSIPVEDNELTVSIELRDGTLEEVQFEGIWAPFRFLDTAQFVVGDVWQLCLGNRRGQPVCMKFKVKNNGGFKVWNQVGNIKLRESFSN
jgi:type VI protein secretion system component VasK